MEPIISDDARLTETDPKRAAQYVRVSREHQRYAIENQIIALRNYAEKHGLEIVRTYADKGISGLRFHKRVALKQLLKDVVSGDADFSMILVYDVSRWGRFQDTDESAHYEFICRQSGIQIEYCGEPFENDGSPISTLVKGIKRLMAAEYSSDLSRRVFSGQRRIVQQGYHAGGPAGIGLRRLVIDHNGNPKEILTLGQQKNLITDRTILVPGPPEEIALVREIFEACAAGEPMRRIAERLKASELPAAKGRRWTNSQVSLLLRNEKYIGNIVWNKRSTKLGTRPVWNPKSEWIRADAVYEPIISRELFDSAREAIESRYAPIPEQELLDGLRRLLTEKGFLSRDLINADDRIPSTRIYYKRFETLQHAYKRIGYQPQRNYKHREIDRSLKRLRIQLAVQTAQRIRQSGTAARLVPGRHSIKVGSNLQISFMALRCLENKKGKRSWTFRPSIRSQSNVAAAARMAHGNKEILDYYLIPKEMMEKSMFRIYEREQPSIDIYRCDSLDPLFAMIDPEDQGSASLSERLKRSIADHQKNPMAPTDKENANTAGFLR